MNYDIYILDAALKKTAIVRQTVTAVLREKVNGIATLTVETADTEAPDYVAVETAFLRLVPLSDEPYSTYRIKEINSRRKGERASTIITARSIIGDTYGEIFPENLGCINYTPQQLMESLLACSSFDVGTVQPESVVPYVRFEYEPVWDCLLRICTLTGGELYLDEESGAIDLLASIGENNGVVFRYGMNLKGASRFIDSSRLTNRVYGVGGGDPPLLLSGATSSGGVKYADDTESINSYGLREAVYHEPTLEEVINLVATPALDGTYSEGLCENWTNVGAAVSLNTNPSYYLYGRASQRVQTSADGQGIQQSAPVTEGTAYSLLANVILVSGTVRVLVLDGTSEYRRAEPVTGSGLSTIRIENWKANNASVTVKILQEGAGNADFYLDSVQIAEGARTKPFTIGKSADILWDHTVEYLNAHKNPEITYDIDLVDIEGNERGRFDSRRFALGDTVMVKDPVLALDVQTRIMQRDFDILHPWRVRVNLDTPRHSLADILVSMREAQEEEVKRMRLAMAESSTAAEVSSTRLGFSRQTFRFFGTITPDTWNSLSWEAGTLRVGDAYYAISADSASGLAGSSTCYFYFDRTNPTKFGYATSSTETEGEDRILVFTVTTTSSPDLPNIYPLGIVHE